MPRLYLSSLIWLPTPPEIDIEVLLRRRIYDVEPKAIDAMLLEALVALGEPGMARRVMHPGGDLAVRLFDHLVTWRRATFDNPLTEAFERSNQARKAAAVGRALGEEIIPALTTENRTEERLSALLQFINDLAEPEALVGLPSFARALPAERDHIIDRIKHSILSNNARDVNAGVMAVFAWLKDDPADVPDALIERIIAAVEIRRWPSLLAILACLTKLVVAKRLPDERIKRLDGPLGELIDETAYERIEPAGPEAVTFSLVRQECVRLAAVLADAGATGPNTSRWLELSANDPLPEVRYAVERGTSIEAVSSTEHSGVR